MTSLKLERVLSLYNDAIDHEKTNSRNHLLPKGLQDSKKNENVPLVDENENDPLVDNGSKDCSQFVLGHVSKQSCLFAAFFTIVHFAIDAFNSYLSVYYKQLGLTAREIGIISSVQPFLAVFYTPLIGYIADKFAIRRIMLVSSLVFMTSANIAMFFVPKARTKECTRFPCNMSSEVLTDDLMNCSSLPFEFVPAKEVTSKDWYNSRDLQIVFIYLIVNNLVAQLAGAPWYPLANGCLLAALGPTNRHQYGYFRGMAGFGGSLGVLVAGVALGMSSFKSTHCYISIEQAQFNVIFILHAVLLLAVPLAWYMSDVPDFKRTNPETSFGISTLTSALCNLRYCSVIIVITWLSIACGKMRTFDFWYIKVLGGSYTMMGWGGFISKTTLMVVSFCLPTLNKKFGHVPILVVSCLAIGGACMCASVITNVAWMAIPLLVRESTNAVYAQAQGAYLGNAVDNQHQATLQSIMGSLTFGIGGGLGSLLGGGLIEDLSPAISYYIFASISFGMAIFLTVIHVIVKLTETTDKKTDYP